MRKLVSKYSVLAVMAICFWMLLVTAADQCALAEDANITISGKITSVAFGMFTPFGNRRAELVVEDAKGKSHKILVGQRTVYVPHRTPDTGDNVSIVCVKKNGTLAGLSVTYK